MSREQYIVELRELLQGLPEVEIDSAVVYCQEYFDESADVAQAIKELGSPRMFANNVIDTSINRAIGSDYHPEGNQSQIRSFWFIILGVLSLPLALPLIILIIALIFTAMMLLLALMLLSLAGMFGAGSLFVATLSSFMIDVQTSLFLLALALCIFGASLMLGSLLVQAGQKFLPWLGKKISNLLNRRGEQHEKNN